MSKTILNSKLYEAMQLMKLRTQSYDEDIGGNRMLDVVNGRI